MARTEEQLRAWYGEHPDGVMRCTDAECVHCEMRNLLAEIDKLRRRPALIGETTSRPDGERVGMNVHPGVRARLRRLLYYPEMRGVGYSEFINRACEAAETEIAQSRRTS